MYVYTFPKIMNTEMCKFSLACHSTIKAFNRDKENKEIKEKYNRKTGFSTQQNTNQSKQSVRKEAFYLKIYILVVTLDEQNFQLFREEEKKKKKYMRKNFNIEQKIND